MSSPRVAPALWAPLALALLAAPGPRAAPGTAFVALVPGPAAGDVDAAAYLTDPAAWPAEAETHPRGWSVGHLSSVPPPEWTRPIVRRGGGRAQRDGELNPRYAAALDEMLPARAGAIVALLDPTDPLACSPGKPNPHPFERDGWLFLHDGAIDIEAITMQVWRAEWGPDWEAFRLAHPRDYDGNGDSTRGNAGEIYGLLFLHELERGPGDPGDAFGRAIGHLLTLPGAEGFQFNALALSAEGLWAVRYAMGDAEAYPIRYGRTTSSEHCVTDSDPPDGAWDSLPNFTLAHFPAGGIVELRALAPGTAGDRVPGSSRPRLRAERTPTAGPVRLIAELPADARGVLQLWTVDGRCLLTRPVRGDARSVAWELPERLASGVYLARLRCNGVEACVRVVRVR